MIATPAANMSEIPRVSHLQLPIPEKTVLASPVSWLIHVMSFTEQNQLIYQPLFNQPCIKMLAVMPLCLCSKLKAPPPTVLNVPWMEQHAPISLPVPPNTETPVPASLSPH